MAVEWWIMVGRVDCMLCGIAGRYERRGGKGEENKLVDRPAGPLGLNRKRTG